MGLKLLRGRHEVKASLAGGAYIAFCAMCARAESQAEVGTPIRNLNAEHLTAAHMPHYGMYAPPADLRFLRSAARVHGGGP
jgi:hypothetical protein